jgi:hypothetical protein
MSFRSLIFTLGTPSDWRAGEPFQSLSCDQSRSVEGVASSWCSQGPGGVPVKREAAPGEGVVEGIEEHRV